MRIAILILLILSLPCYAQNNINLSSANYPPYYGENLKNQGPVTQIVRAAFKEVGYKVKIEFYPWIRGEMLAKEGRVDGMFPPWDKPERRGWGIFSDPIPPTNEIGLYKRRNDLLIFKAYARNILVGVVRGYANPKIFEDSGIGRHIVESDLQNLRILIKKRVDLIIIDKNQAKFLINKHIKKEYNSEYCDNLVWISPAIRVNEQYLIISKKTSQARKKVADFNRGLKIITEQGKVDMILRQSGMR